ncbi:hypothetical protein CC85DRAFT_201475 [Cutaneotrichosporon oleaginosum]|uniref:BTB domain-containing protein n=1 Tax=Cutaneotrichosporon oleaginosum TaxID=879819 RepID=A0A0J0XUE9_9TREE|nr:uncharacterized protein CC85DRAFT_201475 [Cutaneotrichosporon oleaginosum]KLT44672.1 hypothetical protein CC85DRAFT_201475 [Cutaneotrichosporon oleaginosum]TXT07659.1 hypothetical protein COLE_04583 [Cutaneotrichosporon oleaginosum]
MPMPPHSTAVINAHHTPKVANMQQVAMLSTAHSLRNYPHSLPPHHLRSAPIVPRHARSSSLTPSRAPTPTSSISRPHMTSDDLAYCRDFSTPQDVLLVCNAVDSETQRDVGFYVNSAVLRASCAWFAQCIDDRPPDYEPGAVIRIAIDVPVIDMEVLVRMMHAGSPASRSIRVTLGQVLHTIPALMTRFGADRSLWSLLTSYLPPLKLYGLERVGNGYVLRENIWGLLVLAHAARDAKVLANTVGIVLGNRPSEPEWAMLYDPYTVPRAEITPEREVIYRILLAVARMRARVGMHVDFEYTDRHLVVISRKSPEFKLYFELENHDDVLLL